jgi:anthranilate synthase component 2
MKILVLDNYDSFTFNIVHYLEKESDAMISVFRNDQINIEDVKSYDKILLSPGPGIPAEAGIMNELINEYAPSKSILGICLGQQAIAEAFGGKLINLQQVFHGVSVKTKVIKEDFLFTSLPKEFMVGRYHSWAVDPNGLPEELEVIAIDETSRIMALRHKEFDIRGVQFHPESILTEYGAEIIRNWVNG